MSVCTGADRPLCRYNMIFTWSGNEAVSDFAKSLAQDFVDRFPPPVIEELMKEHPTLFQATGNKKSVSRELDKLAATVSRCYQRARQFKRDHKLGVFKTARLSKSFQDELIGLGYRQDFVKELTFGLANALI